ncbi:nucleotidyltransferase family protein [Sporosarcina sp. FSL W8-0480]|uniref:nucleotidyltransferase family protein n=1 Tax=Sporosarcina sp. FSL W8-0480 TaxID=2954701 RepID=UPI0030D96F4B
MIESEKDIIRVIQEDTWMMEILKCVQSLDLPDWWVCAGFVRTKIWDTLYGYEERTPLPDIDVIYFDPSKIDEGIEKEYEKRLTEIYPGQPWSVKNQTRMHLINDFTPYQSSVDAISKFPETVTALGVKLDNIENVVLTAPHGIEDVINFQIRPTPYFSRTEDRLMVFNDRVDKKKWKIRWDRVEIQKGRGQLK